MKYPLTINNWGAEERAAVLAVLDSGQVTMGTRVKEFELAFAKRLGVRHVVMVNSGSSANLIAVAALFYHPEHPLRAGDEAIVPAIAWSTTYAPLHQHGLKLRVVDVDDSLNLDVVQLEAALTPSTRLLVGVSVLGIPAALDTMRAFADRHRLWFLEDNCESLGATLNGRSTGTFGDVGTFSTFFSHHLNTIEGGVLVTDNPALHRLALSLREHGWSRCWAPDGGFYSFVLPGYNVRPTEITAAVGLAQLQKLDTQLKIRHENANLFYEMFAGDKRFLVPERRADSALFGFTLIVRDGDRAAVLVKLRAAGVECRMVTGGCFTLHPAAVCYSFTTVDDLPRARNVHRNGFFVGNSGTDLSRELHYLKEVLG